MPASVETGAAYRTSLSVEALTVADNIALVSTSVLPVKGCSHPLAASSAVQVTSMLTTATGTTVRGCPDAARDKEKRDDPQDCDRRESLGVAHPRVLLESVRRTSERAGP